MRERKEGWGRQYNRHTQLGNPNWNLTNCCLRMATSKLVSVQCNPPYLLYNLWYIQLHSASQTVDSDSLCKFNYVQYKNKLKPQWTPTNYITKREGERESKQNKATKKHWLLPTNTCVSISHTYTCVLTQISTNDKLFWMEQRYHWCCSSALLFSPAINSNCDAIRVCFSVFFFFLFCIWLLHYNCALLLLFLDANQFHYNCQTAVVEF